MGEFQVNQYVTVMDRDGPKAIRILVKVGARKVQDSEGDTWTARNGKPWGCTDPWSPWPYIIPSKPEHGDALKIRNQRNRLRVVLGDIVDAMREMPDTDVAAYHALALPLIEHHKAQESRHA